MSGINVSYHTINDQSDVDANIELIGSDRWILHCPPDTTSAEAFGKLKSPGWSEHKSSQTADHADEGWHGTKDYPRAVELMRYGWEAGTARAEAITSRITATLKKARRPAYVLRPNVAPKGGLMINWHDILTDGPRPFVGKFDTQDEKRGRRIVKICYNASVSCGVSTDIMMARGAAVMALVRALETQRISTQIDIVSCQSAGYGSYGSRGLLIWHVKPAGWPVNNDQLAFALINPASFRRIMFGMIEHTPKQFAPSYYGGYGYPDSIVRSWKDLASQYDIIVDSDCFIAEGKQVPSPEWTSPDKQVAWVMSMLKAQGIDSN